MRVRGAPHGVEAGVIVDLKVRAGQGVGARANLKEKRGAKAKRRNVQDLGIDQVKYYFYLMYCKFEVTYCKTYKVINKPNNVYNYQYFYYFVSFISFYLTITF